MKNKKINIFCLIIISIQIITFSYYYREINVIISLITAIISASIFFKQIYNIIKLENMDIINQTAYSNYLEFISTLEEPDYNFLIEDNNMNKIRILTFDEFIQESINNKLFDKFYKKIDLSKDSNILIPQPPQPPKCRIFREDGKGLVPPENYQK